MNYNFKSYISKLLQDISNKQNEITKDAKEQLDKLLCIFLENICNTCKNTCKACDKKTITDNDVKHVLKDLNNQQLYEQFIELSEEAIEKLKSSDSKGDSRQKQSGLIFPPSVVEHFLKDTGCMKSKNSCVYMCVYLEVFCSYILEKCMEYLPTKNKKRITVKFLECSMKSDQFLQKIIKDMNMYFIGGMGPLYINNELKLKIENDTRKIKKITKSQEIGNQPVLPKKTINEFIRSIVGSNIKISKEVFPIIQNVVEQKIVNLLKKANEITICSGRVKLTKKDIKIANKI